MKTLLVGVVAVALLIGAFFVFNAYIYHEKQVDESAEEAPDTESEVVMTTYTLNNEGLQFDYPSGRGGYTLSDLPVADGEVVPQRSLRILPTTDYVAEQGREGGEGSPAWVVSVYPNTSKLQPSVWMDRFKTVSNIDMAVATPTEMVIGGANAVSYRIDGLYPTEMSVIAHGGYMFVVSVSYLDENSPTYRDREAWINSFTFVPTTTRPAAKIDPRVACESALAYMTFANSTEADAFVEACVAGEHPEVIERYIQSLNLDGATI